MKRRNVLVSAALYLLLLTGALVSTLPMLYMISTALKPNGALYEFPPRFFPSIDELTLENFRYIIQRGGFYLNFLNSVIVSACTIVIAALTASALSFILARFHFKGKGLLFGFIILTMIIPGTTLIVPQYELAVKFGLINKLGGLIPFYAAWVLPFSTFMIRGFIENIPREFDEAIYIDGGSVYTVFFHIALPLASPALASVSIFNFLTAWEEFPWANIVINDNAKRTLPIAIAGFFGQHQFTQWGYVFALSVLSLIPVVLVFIFFQRYFVSGLTTGGIKG
jgi:ABC-type glycerol-3-phosphate transport system permease component